MSLPDENLPLASFVQEEMIDRASQSLAQCLAQLPPIVRLSFSPSCIWSSFRTR